MSTRSRDLTEEAHYDAAVRDEHIADLVVAARAGDKQAWSELVATVDPILFHVARGLRVGRDEDAKDLLQETYLLIIRGLASFDCTRPFLPWAIQVLRNKAADEWDREQAEMRNPQKVGLQQVELSAPFGDDQEHQLVDVVADPRVRDPAADVVEIDAVRVAMKRLDPETMRLLLMAYVYDQSTEEMADWLGITRNAVFVRLHRARRRFAEVFDSAEVLP